MEPLTKIEKGILWVCGGMLLLLGVCGEAPNPFDEMREPELPTLTPRQVEPLGRPGTPYLEEPRSEDEALELWIEWVECLDPGVEV